jgi:regulation of enolase protein 1 (concanavalin A-like superfamily)
MLHPRCLSVLLAAASLLIAPATAEEPKSASSITPGQAKMPKPGGWGEVVDPDGDCKFDFDADKGRLTIAVPGKPHLLSAEAKNLRMNAPRVLRNVQGDFEARARVVGTIRPANVPTASYAPYHGAGLLVWQDAGTYVRLERAMVVTSGRFTPYANFEFRKDGRLEVSVGQEIPDGPTFLRLERRGGEIRAAVSQDGSRWTLFAPIDARLGDSLQVGLAAISSAKKALRAEIEGFAVSGSPGLAPESTSSLVVEAGASKREYRPLEPVEIAFTMTNRSAARVVLSNRRRFYNLVVNDSLGRPVARTRYSLAGDEAGAGTVGQERSLSPGKDLREDVVANLLFDLTLGGDYSVVVEVPLGDGPDPTGPAGAIVRSNPVAVKIAGTPTPGKGP